MQNKGAFEAATQDVQHAIMCRVHWSFIPSLKHYYFTRKYSFSSSSLCRKPDLFLCLLFKVSIPNCMSLNTFYFLMAIRHGEIQMHLCFLQPCLYCVSVLFTVNIQSVYMYEYDSTIHQQMFSFVLDSV